MAASVRSVSTASHDTGTVTVTRPSGTTSGDRLVAICTRDEAVATQAWGSNLFTLVNSTFVSGVGRVQVWERTAGGSEPSSYTYTETSGNSTGTVHLYALQGVDPSAVIVASFANGTGSSNTAPSIASGSYTGNDPLLLTGHYANVNFSTTTFSTPSGMTSRGLVNGPLGYTQCFSASLGLSGTPATSARTSTMGASKPWIAVSVAIPTPNSLTTVSSSDSATGSDAVSGVLRASAVTDSATTADAVSDVLRASAVTDSATGSESVAVSAISFLAVTDSATGNDTLGLVIPDLFSSSDSATGSETLALSINPTQTDSASSSETYGLLRSSAVTDTATSSDSASLLRRSSISDSAAGDDDFDIIVIPEAVPGLAQATTVDYELMCVARINQASGAPSYIEVDPVEWKTLSWSSTLSAPQSLTARCPISSLPASVQQRLASPDRLATELWLTRDGRRVFAGPLTGWRRTGNDVEITASGLMRYLQVMFVLADLRYDQVDQHSIVKQLVDQWQDAVPYGNFGVDTSAVTASGTLRDRSYVRNEGHEVLRRVQELGQVDGGFDSEVDPVTRRLQLWTPTKGVDRSVGGDAIVLDDRNINDPDVMCSIAPGDLASMAFGTSTASGSDTSLWSQAVDDELRAAYGAAGVLSSWSDISEQATLDGHVTAYLQARDKALLVPGPKARVTVDSDVSAYDVGDTITCEMDSVLGVSGAFRIRKRTVDVDESGKETSTLEFV